MTWMSKNMQTSKKLIRTSTKLHLFESNSNTQMTLKNNKMTKQPQQPKQPRRQPAAANPNDLTDEQKLRLKRYAIKKAYNRMKATQESIDRKVKLIKLLTREKQSLQLQYQDALDIFLINASQIDFNF